MKLDKNSYGTLALTWLGTAVFIYSILKFIDNQWVAFGLATVVIWFCIFVTFFFRVPNRKHNGSGKLVTSVADGQIVIRQRAFEKEFLKRDCMMVSIYMNFFDVHANFWPVSGEVTYYKYHPGKHFLAFRPKASEDNEHTCTCIRTDDGKDVFFKQIAGGFARRIVNYSQLGMKVRAGEQCGIIKFGSRIDYYLPLDAEIKVELKEVVRACESIVATL